MTRKLQLIARTAALSLLACSALAQSPISPELEQRDYARDSLAHARTDRLNGAAKASDLIGLTVKKL